MMPLNPQDVMNAGPIVPAASRGNIYDYAAPVPNVAQSLRGWFKPMLITIITRIIVRGSAVPRSVDVQTAGVMQPGDPEKLNKLPEGNRSWRNFTLHVAPGLGAQTNDVIKIQGVSYTIMESYGYNDFGYEQFELVEGYRNASR